MGLYSWMQGAFACQDGYSNYPLVDTPGIYEDALKATAWTGDIQQKYKNQFTQTQPVGGNPDTGEPDRATNDLSRALLIYQKAAEAATVWPKSTRVWAGLVNSMNAVAAAAVTVLSIYSNCPAVAINAAIFKGDLTNPPQEMKTRDSYIKMLKDIVENVHRTWTDGMAEQGGTLSTRFSSDSGAVKAAFAAATAAELASYNRTIAAIN
jgi:hypothetical protein